MNTDNQENKQLITAGFLKNFAEKSKNIFRAEQIECGNSLLLVSDIEYNQIVTDPSKHFIQIKDSNNYDTTISCEITPDDDPNEPKNKTINVKVLCKGTPTMVYLCKCQKIKDGSFYYAFIIKLIDGTFATVDVTTFGKKKNNSDKWIIYPVNEIAYKIEESETYVLANVKNSICIFKGAGTKENPYEEDIVYLNSASIDLESYTKLIETDNKEVIYVKGDVPNQVYYKSNLSDQEELITEDFKPRISGLKLKLNEYFYYKEEDSEKDIKQYLNIDDFTANLKLSNACVKYSGFKNIENIETKSYDDLNEVQKDSTESCLISEDINSGNGKIPGIFDSTRALLAKESDHSKKSDHSKETDKFSEDKTISFPERENTFIITGPAVTSNFENEVVLPTIEFAGVEVVDDSGVALSRGGWYNEVYIKPGNKGLVTKVRKTSLNPENPALPYVNTENLDQLYFRIDDRKSITEEIPIYQSISQIFNCVINEEEIQDGTFITNISTSDKPICVFYHEDGTPIPLSYGYDPITSDTVSNANIICNTGDYGERVIELKKGNEIVAQITFTNITSNAGMVSNESSMKFIYMLPETNEYDGEIEYNGKVYKYKWTTLPSYSNVIGTCENLTLLQIDLSNASLSEVYVNLYKQLTGQDDIVALSDKKIIVLGNDGLLIKKGTKEFKFQI